NGDGLFNGLSIGAYVAGRHRHHRRRQRWIHGHRKIGNADGPGENDHQGADRGKYRPVNEEINKQSESSFGESSFLLAVSANFRLLCPGRGFVTGHDFSRAEKTSINVLGFSPCRDTPTVELLQRPASSPF